MKALISAFAMLSLVIISTVSVGIYTDRALSSFSVSIEENLPYGCENAVYGVKEIENDYKRLKPFLILFIRGGEVNDIELYIEDAKNAAQEKDTAALYEAKGRLKLHIDQLRRLSVFSLEAIF